MENKQRKEIKKRVQREVYEEVLNTLMWNRNYHDKKLHEYLAKGETHLFVINYEQFIAYDELLKALKHFKF